MTSRRGGTRRAAALLVAGLLGLDALGARAQSPDDPPLVEEFFFTESAHPQEKGDVQVTWSVFQRSHRGRLLTDAGLLAEYGIAERLEVEAQMPWLRRREEGPGAVSGLGNADIGILAKVTVEFWTRGPFP